MTYTRSQRADIARALKAAKPFLWDGVSDRNGKHNYICHAIEDSKRVGKQMAKEVILGRLHPHYSFDAWLVTNGVQEKRLTASLVQAHRHAWLDMLIEEFSK